MNCVTYCVLWHEWACLTVDTLDFVSPSKHSAVYLWRHWSQWPLESESLSQLEREEKKGKKGSTFSNWTSKHTKSHTECVEGEKKSTVLNLHSIDGSVRFWSLSTLANCTHTLAHSCTQNILLCTCESDWLTDWLSGVYMYVFFCFVNCNYTQHNSLFTAHTCIFVLPWTSGISLFTFQIVLHLASETKMK